MMKIFGVDARLLIDTGSNNSFASTEFAKHSNRPLTPLEEELLVITPLGERLYRSTVFKACEVGVERGILEADLIPLKMRDFDAILGMDWLHPHRASVNCFTKEVEFRRPGYSPLVFVGERRILPSCVISALEARKLVYKGCEAYLAHIIDTTVQSLELMNVPVVNEFLDVFLDELPGLLPVREFDFAIDLIPNTAPISIPPNRMTSAELKELKVQL